MAHWQDQAKSPTLRTIQTKALNQSGNTLVQKVVLTGLIFVGCMGLIAQNAVAEPAKPATAPAKPATPIKWETLTLEQQKILAPIGAEWKTFDVAQQKHLIGISKTYPKMSPVEQKRFQKHLVDWSRLTPWQREMARRNYQMLKSLSPKERNEAKQLWQKKQATVPAPAKPAPVAKPSTAPTAK